MIGELSLPVEVTVQLFLESELPSAGSSQISDHPPAALTAAAAVNERYGNNDSLTEQ